MHDPRDDGFRQCLEILGDSSSPDPLAVPILRDLLRVLGTDAARERVELWEYEHDKEITP